MTLMRFWLEPDDVESFKVSGGVSLSDAVTQLEARTNEAILGREHFSRTVNLASQLNQSSSSYQLTWAEGKQDTILQVQGPDKDGILPVVVDIISKHI